MSGSSLSSLVSLGTVLVVGLPVILGAIFVIVVIANRAEPDPTGQRPAVVYMLAVSFVSLFAILLATTNAIAALASLIGRRAGGDVGIHPVGDAVARTVALSFLIAGVAGFLLRMHLRGAMHGRGAVTHTPGVPLSAVERVWQSYSAAVSFLGVVIMAGASIVAVYSVLRLLGPAVFSTRDRTRAAAARVLFPSVYLAAAAGAIVLAHQRVVGPLRSFGIIGPFGRLKTGGDPPA